jgi:hypothetical protein
LKKEKEEILEKIWVVQQEKDDLWVKLKEEKEKYQQLAE